MSQRTTISVSVAPDPFLSQARERAAFVPTTSAEISDALRSLKDTVPVDTAQQELRDSTSARRPLMGHALKPDRFAYVQVVRKNGTPVPLYSGVGGLANVVAPASQFGALEPIVSRVVDTLNQVKSTLLETVYGTEHAFARSAPEISAPNSLAWNDWILTGVQESRVEKTQLMETFGGNFLYTYGQKPLVLSFTGQLLNTPHYNWRQIFTQNWDQYFRASRLVDMGARMYLVFDDVLVEGYGLNMSISQSAQMPGLLPFSFTFLATKHIDLSTRNGLAEGAREIAGNNEVLWGVSNKGGRYSSSRKSVLDWLPVLGNKWISEQAQAAAGLDPNQVDFASDGDRFTSQLVSDLLSSVRRGAFAATAGPANFANFLRATALQTARLTLGRGADLAVGALETAFDLKRGEVNNWFGYLGAVLQQLLSAPQWAAGGGRALQALGIASEIVGQGGIEQIVDTMSFAAVSGLGYTVQKPTYLPDNGTLAMYARPDTFTTWKPPSSGYDNRGGTGMVFT